MEILNKIKEKVSGYCPEQQEEVTIEITYRRVTSMGGKKTFYLPMNFVCPYSRFKKCATFQTREGCPIYKKARKTE